MSRLPSFFVVSRNAAESKPPPSPAGYGRIGFERRFRIFDLSSYGERISTYKHTESGQIQDKMDLVGGEAPGFV